MRAHSLVLRTPMLVVAWMSALASLAQTGTPQPPKPRSVEHTRLVPANLPPPPVERTLSGKGIRVSAFYQILAKAGPAYNEGRVRRELEKGLIEDVERGKELLRKTGQRGILLKVQLVSQVTPGGQDFYSLRGDGVILVGVGPDANSVCYVARCFNVVETDLPSGAKVTTGSGYLWVEPEGSNRHRVSAFDIGAMEARATKLSIDAQAADQAMYTARTHAIDDFTKAARAAATSERDKTMLASLADQRANAIKKIGEVEEALAAELRRQERIARVSSTLNTIAAAFTLASAISTATVSIGEDVSAAVPGGIQSKESLVAAVNSLAAESNAKIVTLTTQQTTVRTSLGLIETSITTIGIAVGLDPAAVPVMTPPKP